MAGSHYLYDNQHHSNMSHISLTYHIIWRTKKSALTINENHERELYAYLHGICKGKECHLYRVNSMPDHVHMCLEIPPTIAVSDFMQVIKQESSRWMKEHKEWFPYFEGWGNGYGAFTYSVKERPTIIEYIKNQKEHHSKRSFHDEFETILIEFGIDPKKDLFFRD